MELRANNGTSLWNVVRNSGLVGHDTYTIAEVDKKATVVGLSLTTVDDGGRGQVLSKVDQRQSPADYTQLPGYSDVVKYA